MIKMMRRTQMRAERAENNKNNKGDLIAGEVRTARRRTPKYAAQYLVCAVILKFLYHSLRVLYRHDERVRQDLDRIDRGTLIRLSCASRGPSLEIVATENGIDRFSPEPARRFGSAPTCRGKARRQTVSNGPTGNSLPERSPDIDIRFKGIQFSFSVFTGQTGIAEAFSQHMMYVNGDFSKIMSLVRCMEHAERYLFPSFIGRKILKTLLPKRISSLRLYATILRSMIIR